VPKREGPADVENSLSRDPWGGEKKTGKTGILKARITRHGQTVADPPSAKGDEESREDPNLDSELCQQSYSNDTIGRLLINEMAEYEIEYAVSRYEGSFWRE